MSDEFNNTTTEEETPDVVLDLADDNTSDTTSIEDGDDEFEDEEDAPEPAWSKPGKWYVVHTQAGYEKRLKPT